MLPNLDNDSLSSAFDVLAGITNISSIADVAEPSGLLRYFGLQDNFKLNCTIPSFVGKQPELNTLNLFNNNLTGLVPGELIL